MNKPLRTTHTWVSAAAVLVCTGALAQTTPAQRVEITARPIVEQNRVDPYGALATEVGAEQLRDLNALDLSSALRRSPGVVVSRFNPVGSFGGDEGGAVYVRGLGASRPGSEIKTYVDGIPFYMGVWNHALLDLLPVHGMERISVYKGPQPQRFGNTFAAIDLTPQRGRAPGWAADLRLSAGSFSTAVEQANVAWAGQEGEFSLAQSHARSNGHRVDAEGRLDNLMLRGTAKLSPQWQMGGLVLGADNDVSDPGVQGDASSKTGHFKTRGRLVSGSVSHDHGAWQGRLQLYANEGTGLWDQGAAADVRSRFKLSGLRWRETGRLTEATTVDLGLDVDRMSGSVAFDGFMAFDGVSMRLSAPFVAVSHAMPLGGGWTATPSAGVRLYRHNVYGSDTAPHLGLTLGDAGPWALRLHAARGLNHPGLDAALLNAIVPPLAGAPLSWRNLNPERMDHVELGARYSTPRGTQLDVALFQDELKNRYVFAFPPAVALPSFTNLGNYRVQGAELSWHQSWSPAWSSFAGLTLLDSSLADLPYAPRRALGAGLTWQQGPWRVSADAQAQSSTVVLNRARASGAPNTGSVAGFALVNVRAAHAWPVLGPRGEWFVAIENLGNRAYAVRPGYPMPGRSAQLGLRFTL